MNLKAFALALSTLIGLVPLSPTTTGASSAHRIWLSWAFVGQTGVPGNKGKSIKLRNTAAPGETPTARVELYWAYYSCGPAALAHNHPGKPHAPSYGESYVRIKAPNGSFDYIPGSVNSDPAYTVNPLISGYSGSVSITIISKVSGVVLESFSASWDFEKPQDCKSCTTGCAVDKAINSIDIDVPVGNVTYGQDAPNFIKFKSEELANPGRSALTFDGLLSNGFSETTSTGNLLTTVTTGNSVATLMDDPTTEDPNRFQIFFTYIDDPRSNPPTPVYRIMTFEMSGGNFVFTDDFDGVSQVTVFSKPDADTWVMTENGKRRTTRETTFEDDTNLVYLHTVEEKSDLDAAWKVISKEEEHQKDFGWRWVTTKRILDPDGAALTSEWDYYELDPLDPEAPEAGRLKREKLPTGMVRNYTYLDTNPYHSGYSSVEIIKEHFADIPDGKETRIHRGVISGVDTVLREEFVGGDLVSKVETSGNSTLRTEKVYPSASGTPLVTEYRQIPYTGREITRPDGTVERTSFQTANGLLTKTTSTGVKNPGSGHYLLRGEETVQEIRRNGIEQRSIRRAIQDGVVYRLEERVMATEDHRGRDLRTDVFHGNAGQKSYSIYRSYSCCGVAAETGENGLTRRYFYDDLGRVRKSHFMGIAEETLRDGLTMHTHRYPEALAVATGAAVSGNLLGSVTMDLSGEPVSRAARSPQDGSLQSTLLLVEYQPAAGIGKRITTLYPVTADDGSSIPFSVNSYYSDGNLAAVTGNMRTNQVYIYGATSLGIVESVANLRADSSLFGNIHRQSDLAGRLIGVTYSGDKNGDSLPDQEVTIYGSDGLPSASADSDGVTTLHAWDITSGNRTQAIDKNGNGVIDLGDDYVSRSRSGISSKAGGILVQWETAEIWDGGTSSWKPISTSEITSDGNHRRSISYKGTQTISTITELRFSSSTLGNWTEMSEGPDGRSKVDRYVAGFAVGSDFLDASGKAVRQIGRTYDAMNRLTTETNSSIGAPVSHTYVSPFLGFIASSTDATGTISFTYDHRGRRKTVDAPDTEDHQNANVTNTTTYSYDLPGNILEINGTPGYRTAYTYNDQQQMATLTTFGTSTAVTRWEYDEDRGWLTRKRHDSSAPGTGLGPAYTYTAAGRLATRTWARGVSTTYSYDTAGFLSGADYSDATPDVQILERDSLGRVTRLIDGAGESVISHAATDLSMAVTWQTGSLFGEWTVRTGHDASGRLAGLAVEDDSTPVHQIEYEYDMEGRPASVQDAQGHTARYHYDAMGRLRQTSIGAGGIDFLYGTRSHDAAGHLERITYHGSLDADFKVFSDYGYTRNSVGQITGISLKDGSSQSVGYYASGEVASVRQRHLAANPALREGTTRSYAYDGIGNRLTAAKGGDASGNNLAVTSYTPDSLNRYTGITNPGVVGVSGLADASAAVTVNGAAASRQGDRFHKEITADNSAGPVSLEVEVESGSESSSGRLLILPATQSPGYDADGNLLSDGVHQFTWDAENRLIRIEVTAAAVTAGVPYRRVENAFDHGSRRIRRAMYDSVSGLEVEDTRYLWAGWRCLVELAADSTVSRKLVWGMGRSGAIDLGDGNDALLWMHATAAGSHFCHYDGNGNITGLSDAVGQRTAEYGYDAFGVLAGIRGPYAESNPYRFSAKPFEDVGDLYYYGHRFYHPVVGRWIGRDPIEERGGVNLYGFIHNDSMNGIDIVGLNGIVFYFRPTPILRPIVQGQAGEYVMPRAPTFRPTYSPSVRPNWSPSQLPLPIVPNTELSPYSTPSNKFDPAVGFDPASVRRWENSPRDEAERGRRRDLSSRCQEIYKGHHPKRIPYRSATNCKDLWDAYVGASRERHARAEYISLDCDQIPWNPGSAPRDHPGQLENVDRELNNIIEKLKKECWNKGCRKLFWLDHTFDREDIPVYYDPYMT